MIGGLPEGKKKIFMLGQEIPESLAEDAPEPNVTGQLLDLKDKFIYLYEKGSMSVAEYSEME